MAFKDNLRSFRLAAKLTQEQLGHAIGAAGQSRIANYEKGLREPTLGEIVAMADALGTSPAQLVGWLPPIHHPESSNQLTPLDAPASQSWRLDPVTLRHALDLLAFDEDQAGAYPPMRQAERLVDIYARIAADGGVQLSDEASDAFESEVWARAHRMGETERGSTGTAEQQQRRPGKRK